MGKKRDDGWHPPKSDMTLKKEQNMFMINRHEFFLKTAPFDPRFPSQNQTRRCWQNYVDYHRCRAILGEDEDKCEYFLRMYRILCPKFWVEKWDDQRKKQVFPGKGTHWVATPPCLPSQKRVEEEPAPEEEPQAA